MIYTSCMSCLLAATLLLCSAIAIGTDGSAPRLPQLANLGLDWPSIDTADGDITVRGENIMLQTRTQLLDVDTLATMISTITQQAEDISALKAQVSLLSSSFDTFQGNPDLAIAIAGGKLTLTLNASETRDLGAIICEAFESPAVDHLVVMLEPNVETDTFYEWDVLCTLPPNSFLEIQATQYQHTSVSVDIAQDDLRCPARIRMDDTHLVYPDRQEGEGYYNYIKYHRLIVSQHAHVTFRGVSIVEDIVQDAPQRIYEPGLITLRGPFSSVRVYDSSVKFGQPIFINSHQSGITHVTLMHVRFISDSNETVYPVDASRGQSTVGNLCYVSRTGGRMEGAVEWAEERLTGTFQLQYLS